MSGAGSAPSGRVLFDLDALRADRGFETRLAPKLSVNPGDAWRQVGILRVGHFSIVA